MSTTTDAEGGYTVPEEWAREVIDALKEYRGTSAQMNFPTLDGMSEVDLSKVTTVPFALLQDPAVDIEAFIRARRADHLC